MKNVSVNLDESIGGIEREYREVKRKARVGEQIKIVGERIGYNIGSVFTVEDDDYPWGKVFRDGTGVAIDGGNPLFHKNYVVLEPTDIVRIDNERLRMVDRKAAVGERVIVTDQVNDDRFSIGEIYEVVYVYGGSAWVEHPLGMHVESGGALLPNYRLLEPVETAAPTAPLSAQSPIDQAAANISALTAKVQALESRVAALEKAPVAAGPVDNTPPSFIAPPKPPQQLRDEIVERAKADVESLLKRVIDGVPCVNTGGTATYWPEADEVEFVVNRDKRKVTALIRAAGFTKIWAVGRAICAPNDVFNAHIGRAIAMHKALGLEVPAEYLNVPNPEEPRVGDVVVDKDYGVGVVSEMRPKGYLSSDEGLTVDGGPGSDGYWTFIRDVTILDDSREEEGVAA